MLRFSNLPHNQDLSTLPKVELTKIRLLWHSDFWDGVLNGVLLYQSRKYWFEIFDEDKDVRRYFIIELTEDQLQGEEYWHTLFQEKVGMHTDYDENGNRPRYPLKPPEAWSEFYDAYETRMPQDYSRNPVIGWFER